MFRASFVLLLLGAFALRVFRLDAQSLWWDEGISLHLAASSLSEIVADRAGNLHPPLYFILLKGWVGLAGFNEFSVRYLSVLASFLQVAVAYLISRNWFGRAAAWGVACFVTIWPLSVIYAQETRVYAFLPLVYLALLALTYRLIRLHHGRRLILWLALGLAEWAALHLHYISFIVVAYVNFWFLFRCIGQRQWLKSRRWLFVQLGVAIASLPWLVTVLNHWPDVQARINTGRGLTEPAPLTFLVAQSWTFHFTGLAGLLAHPTASALATLTAIALAILLLVRIWDKGERFLLLRTTAQWLLPVSASFFIWSIRSFSHPRYLAMAAIGLLPLVATLIFSKGAKGGQKWLTWLLSAIVTASIISLSFLALNTYFFDPSAQKDDTRGVARYLEREAGPEDLIFVPDEAWVLPIEYEGEAVMRMAGLDERNRMWARLAQWTTPEQQVYTVKGSVSRDWQEILPFSLEAAGAAIDSQQFDGWRVRRYRLDTSVAQPDFTSLEEHAGPLTLSGAWVEPTAAANSAVAIALRWQLAQPTAESYRIALRLMDEDGWQMAAADALLINRQGRSTDSWTPGNEVTTYHLLPVPLGTPPLNYRVAAGLYILRENEPQAIEWSGKPVQRQFLGTVQLTRPLSKEHPYGQSPSIPPAAGHIKLNNGLELLHATLDPVTLHPGQSLFVHLLWRATQAPLPDLRPRLSVITGDETVVSSEDAPVSGRYPTTLWTVGELVQEHRALRLPPAVRAGPARVVLAVGDEETTVGEITIRAEARSFKEPSAQFPMDVRFDDLARLVGFDLPEQEVVAGEPVLVTLYWQALRTGAEDNYTVFTHMLGADGRLFAQHDGTPAEGKRPIGGWVEGEYIADPHLMVFSEDYTGPATIRVGLYDPKTGERLFTDQGRDHVALPVVLEVRD